MTNHRTKLELTWIGKDDRPRLEPRILLEHQELSYAKRAATNDLFDNLLIHGDNLLALKALEQELAGRVKCVFIDPPYNTGTAFEHYDDGLEHSLWLSLMRHRLELLHTLLREDGTLWISIDDNEGHYLKVLCDEIFGRRNFVATCIWQKKHTRANDARWLSDNHDFVLCYAKSKELWRPRLLPRNSEEKGYSNPDNDPRGPWASGPCHVKTPAAHCIYEIVTPSGREVWPPPSTSWRFTRQRFAELVADNRIYFGPDGNNVPRYKRFLSEVQQGLVPTTLWLREEVGDNQEAKQEAKSLIPNEPFGTPKPERLIARILTIATQDGDLVLDSFLGSGTTAAVAHKMGRRWIGVELGDHAVTHCAPRLKKVIDGLDSGGITEAVGWKGGGGFRFFKLAPSLLEKDKWGNWIVSKQYKPEMLAEAMCKHQGFRYAPDREVFWNHGHSTERDFIYVTTQNLSPDQLQFISEQVGPDRSLLICCSAFRGKPDLPNLTLSKIPQAVLARCEWGRDDYSLNVTEQAPVVAVEEAETEAFSNGTKTKSGGRRKKATPVQELPLFARIDNGSK